MAKKTFLTIDLDRAGMYFRPFWIFIALAVALLILTSGFFTYLAVTTIERGVSSLHLEIAQHAQSIIAKSFEGFFAEQQRVATALGRRPSQWNEIISLSLKDNPTFEQMSFTDTRGVEIARLNRISIVDKSRLADYGRDERFGQAIAENGLVGRVFFSERAEPLLSIFTPIRTLEGELKGMLITDLNLKFMWRLTAEITVGSRGRAYVVDKLGNLIADPDPSLVLRKENLLFRPLVKKLVEGQKLVDGLDAGDRYNDFSGRKVFAAGIRMEDLGWGVITEEPLEDAFLASRRTLAVGTGLSLSSVILLLFLSFTIGRLSRATRFLEEERAHSYSIIHNLTDGIIEYSTDFRILLLNPEAERLLGVNAAEIVGRTLFDIERSPHPEPASFLKVFSDLPVPKGVKPEKLRGRKTEELALTEPLERTLEINTVPVVAFDGTILSNIKILRDVTREKLLDRLKSEFISIAAHQLRTPLSAVKWTLRLFLDGDLGATSQSQREYLQSSYETNERMIRLVNDLLDVSRIEEGRFQYNFREDEDLVNLVERAAATFHEIAGKRNVSLSIEKPKTPLLLLTLDRDRIQMALQNVIENALTYTKPGGRVSIKIYGRKNAAVVEVADTGIGIAPEDVKKLFTKFHRSSEAIKMHPNGSGLGLFISNNMVRRHGGQIEVESEVGKGSVFRIILPTAVTEQVREGVGFEEFFAGLSPPPAGK